MSYAQLRFGLFLFQANLQNSGMRCLFKTFSVSHDEPTFCSLPFPFIELTKDRPRSITVEEDLCHYFFVFPKRKTPCRLIARLQETLRDLGRVR
jgi:hypothetical protein